MYANFFLKLLNDLIWVHYPYSTIFRHPYNGKSSAVKNFWTMQGCLTALDFPSCDRVTSRVHCMNLVPRCRLREARICWQVNKSWTELAIKTIGPTHFIRTMTCFRFVQSAPLVKNYTVIKKCSPYSFDNEFRSIE